MKNTEETERRTRLRGKVEEAVRAIYGQDQQDQQDQTEDQEQDPYQIHAPISPYMKAGFYLVGAFILVWSSQYVMEALAGVIRQYKNLKRAIKE